MVRRLKSAESRVYDNLTHKHDKLGIAGQTGAMNTAATTVAQTITARRTTKHFVDPAARHEKLVRLSDDDRAALNHMLAAAGQAPFHKPADESTHRQGPLTSVVPWRFHVLEPKSCIALVDWLEQQAATDTLPWTRAWSSKIPALLSAAGAAIIVTWLPNPGSDDNPEFAHANIEHVAAAGAAVQNLLLLAEAQAWDSYWSSGGALREPETFKLLGISASERLLGAIMLNPRTRDTDKSLPGGLYDQRGDVTQWARHVQL